MPKKAYASTLSEVFDMRSACNLAAFLNQAINLSSRGLHIALLTIVAATTAISQTYTITDLGTLSHMPPNDYSYAYGLNNSGQVVGISSLNGASSPAFLYSGGTMVSLGTLGGADSVAKGINVMGRITGYSETLNGYAAFLYSNGTMQNIGTLGGNFAAGYAINALGQITGDSKNKMGQDHAFLYTGGNMVDLGTLGGNSSTGSGINNRGQVVGYAYNASGNFLAFLYSAGKMQSLGTLGGDWSLATAINDQTQITGQAYTPGNLQAHAFLYSKGTMIDLGVLPGGVYSRGESINRYGVVVGQSTVLSHEFLEYHAFVYSNGKMQDLNDLIPPRTGWLLSEATGINDNGQIAGYGSINGETHAFLLTTR